MTSRGQCKTSTPVDGEGTNPKTALDDPSGALCEEGCLYDGEHKNKNMVRCCQCAAWVHIECINKTEEYVPGVWPCFRCRQIQVKLKTMQELISDLVKTVNHMNSNLDTLKQENEKIKDFLKERDDKLEDIVLENTELRGRISMLSNSASADHWHNLRRPHGTVLVGSSLVRDIDENKLYNTKVVCIPGGKINDIKDKISSMPTQPKLERIVLVVGGNDCSSRDHEPQRPLMDLVDGYSDLIKCAQEVAVAVTVSSVCPRNSGDEVAERISALNAGLKVLCDDLRFFFFHIAAALAGV